MKPFYIVPNSCKYYDTVNADSTTDALATFAENMDSDMSTYFSAVEEEPVQYPHGYKYPEGKFQLSMAIIMDTMSGNEKAPYYIKDALNGVDISRMDVIAKL